MSEEQLAYSGLLQM